VVTVGHQASGGSDGEQWTGERRQALSEQPWWRHPHERRGRRSVHRPTGERGGGGVRHVRSWDRARSTDKVESGGGKTGENGWSET
jgi:hypothetical protein